MPLQSSVSSQARNRPLRAAVARILAPGQLDSFPAQELTRLAPALRSDCYRIRRSSQFRVLSYYENPLVATSSRVLLKFPFDVSTALPAGDVSKKN